MRRPSASSASDPAAVVAVSVRSSRSSAVGPSSTFPQVVGETSTPLVRAVGTGSRMRVRSRRASLSNTMSWPRRGVTVKSRWPSSPSMRSAPRPAALTSQRARTDAGGHPDLVALVARRRPRSPGVPSRRSAPAPTASVAKARVTDHGSMTHSPGTDSPDRAPGPRWGSRARTSSAPTSDASAHPLASALVEQARAAPPPARRPTPPAGPRSARRRSRRRPRSRPGGRGPAAPGADSSEPGSVSNPVWRMAVLALDVPSPTSAARSRTTTEAPSRARWRAMAQPTTPAPTTATSHLAGPPAGATAAQSPSEAATARSAAAVNRASRSAASSAPIRGS